MRNTKISGFRIYQMYKKSDIFLFFLFTKYWFIHIEN